jgi:hypothetical protein
MVLPERNSHRAPSSRSAEELAADGDLADVAVWLWIIDSTGGLAITTPFGLRRLFGCTFPLIE